MQTTKDILEMLDLCKLLFGGLTIDAGCLELKIKTSEHRSCVFIVYFFRRALHPVLEFKLLALNLYFFVDTAIPVYYYFLFLF